MATSRITTLLTSAEYWNNNFTFRALDEFDPSSMEPQTTRNDDGTTSAKLYDGHPAYVLGEIQVKDADGSSVHNISLKVFNKPLATIEDLTSFVLVGNVRVQPWATAPRNGSRFVNINYSLIADSIAPVDSNKGVNK